MKKVIISVICFLIHLSWSYSQTNFKDGFIITSKNDTVYGLIDNRSNIKSYESCLFKSDSIVTEFTPNQITGFGFKNGRYFTSTVVPYSFAEVLVSGELSLYRYKDYYFLGKNNGEIAKLESNPIEVEVDGDIKIREDHKWRGVLSHFISDCSHLSGNDVKNLQLADKYLTKLVIQYNTCKESDFIVFNEGKPWVKVEPGLTVGLTTTFLAVGEYPKHLFWEGNIKLYKHVGKSYSSTAPSAGLLFDINSPRLQERIYIQTGLHYLRTHYSALVKLNSLSQDEFHETYIDLSTITTPLSIKYTVPHHKNSYSLQGGVLIDHHIKKSTRLLSEIIHKNNIVTTIPETTAFEIMDRQPGGWGSISIMRSFEEFSVSTALSYYNLTERLNKSQHFYTKSQRIALSIIIYRK